MQQRAGRNLHVRDDDLVRSLIRAIDRRSTWRLSGTFLQWRREFETPAGPLGQPRHFDDGPDAVDIPSKPQANKTFVKRPIAVIAAFVSARVAHGIARSDMAAD